jgi:hypothetical protein
MKRMFSRRVTVAVALGSTLLYSTESKHSAALFKRLASLHASKSPTPEDLSNLVTALAIGDTSGSVSDQATAWRTLGGSTFLVPLVS